MRNDGKRPATNVQALLPNVNALSKVGFQKYKTSDTSNIILNGGENATLTIGVSPDITDTLGELIGGIVIESTETWASINYRHVHNLITLIIIAGIVILLNLTLICHFLMQICDCLIQSPEFNSIC